MGWRDWLDSAGASAGPVTEGVGVELLIIELPLLLDCAKAVPAVRSAMAAA